MEAKAIKDKSARAVASFLYEIICRHGYIDDMTIPSKCIKINHQRKEFVNQVAESLHNLTRTERRITSAYHPKSNDICERQNRTIKESLIKVLEDFF